MEIKKSGWGFTSTRRRGDASGVRFPRGKEENGATHVGVARASSLFAFFFFTSQLRSASLPCATRPNDNRRTNKKKNRTLLRQPAIPVRKTMVPTQAPLCKLRVPRLQACFYITASSAFFMSTHHVAKTWSFLKGHGRRRAHVSDPRQWQRQQRQWQRRPGVPAAADRWFSPG